MPKVRNTAKLEILSELAITGLLIDPKKHIHTKVSTAFTNLKYNNLKEANNLK